MSTARALPAGAKGGDGGLKLATRIRTSERNPSARKSPSNHGNRPLKTCESIPLLKQQFIHEVRNFARAADLSDVLEISLTTAWRYMRGRKRASFRLSKPALRVAWKDYKMGLRVNVNHIIGMRGTSERKSNRGCIYSPGDALFVKQHIGTMPLEEIARLLKRTRCGVVTMLNERLDMKGEAFRNSVNAVAAAIGVSPSTVQDWCHARRVRSYLEVRWRIIHRDDADWLRKHYKRGQYFAPFPGASDKQRLELQRSYEVAKLPRPAYCKPIKQELLNAA